MQPLSKGFYLGSIIGGWILCIVLGGVSIGLTVSGAEEAGMALALLAYPPMIYAVVIVCVLIYKIWAAIQGPTARTTPGKAVGFLFIPFYNFYWQFMAFWGWTKDYNALVQQRGLSARRAPEGLALTICILTLAAIIPFLGYLIALVNLILMIIFYNAAIDGANAVASASPAPRGTAESPPAQPGGPAVG